MIRLFSTYACVPRLYQELCWIIAVAEQTWPSLTASVARSGPKNIRRLGSIICAAEWSERCLPQFWPGQPPKQLTGLVWERGQAFPMGSWMGAPCFVGRESSIAWLCLTAGQLALGQEASARRV